MLNRYLAGVALTSLTLWAALTAASPAPQPLPSCPPALRDRYSPRALRRIRSLLQLRILQARRDRLALAQGAVTHQVTIEQILAAPDDAAVLMQESGDMRLKHFHVDGARMSWQDASTVFKPGWRSSRSEDENMLGQDASTVFNRDGVPREARMRTCRGRMPRPFSSQDGVPREARMKTSAGSRQQMLHRERASWLSIPHPNPMG